MRLIFLLRYKQRGAVVNIFKSIISPAELNVQYSIVLHKRVLELKTLLSPIILKHNLLKRYGSTFDGGYVIPKIAIEKSHFLISGGIETNNDFEIELAKLGMVGVQIDNSIDSAPKVHKNLTFIRATLGKKSEFDLEKTISKYPIGKKGILKLDIEGAEYETLKNINDLGRFNAIIIEFHNMYRITDEGFWKGYKKLLKRLNRNFNVVYMNANNCCGFTIIGGIPIPNVVEITFIRKDLLKKKDYLVTQLNKTTFNNQNYSDRAPLDISFFIPSEIIK